VYLHNPARNSGISHKFTPVWQGPFSVKECVGEVDYKIVDMKGKGSVVHINRVKVSQDPSIWRPKAQSCDPVMPGQARRAQRTKKKKNAYRWWLYQTW
jgi:hypothetical protein